MGCLAAALCLLLWLGGCGGPPPGAGEGPAGSVPPAGEGVEQVEAASGEGGPFTVDTPIEEVMGDPFSGNTAG